MHIVSSAMQPARPLSKQRGASSTATGSRSAGKSQARTTPAPMPPRPAPAGAAMWAPSVSMEPYRSMAPYTVMQAGYPMYPPVISYGYGYPPAFQYSYGYALNHPALSSSVPPGSRVSAPASSQRQPPPPPGLADHCTVKQQQDDDVAADDSMQRPQAARVSTGQVQSSRAPAVSSEVGSIPAPPSTQQAPQAVSAGATATSATTNTNTTNTTSISHSRSSPSSSAVLPPIPQHPPAAAASSDNEEDIPIAVLAASVSAQSKTSDSAVKGPPRPRRGARPDQRNAAALSMRADISGDGDPGVSGNHPLGSRHVPEPLPHPSAGVVWPQSAHHGPTVAHVPPPPPPPPLPRYPPHWQSNPHAARAQPGLDSAAYTAASYAPYPQLPHPGVAMSGPYHLHPYGVHHAGAVYHPMMYGVPQAVPAPPGVTSSGSAADTSATDVHSSSRRPGQAIDPATGAAHSPSSAVRPPATALLYPAHHPLYAGAHPAYGMMYPHLPQQHLDPWSIDPRVKQEPLEDEGTTTCLRCWCAFPVSNSCSC